MQMLKSSNQGENIVAYFSQQKGSAQEEETVLCYSLLHASENSAYSATFSAVLFRGRVWNIFSSLETLTF